MSNTYVALLRGINVGGNNIVSMKALKQSFEQLGFKDVSTYINSGNVLFRTKAADARKLESKIDRMLAQEYLLQGGTVVRSHAEMSRLNQTIAETWKRRSEDWRYNVVFLRSEIDSDTVLEAVAIKPDIERVVYCPGTLLWSARADGLTRSAMSKLASRPIYKQMTVRNINTTMKLCDLLDRLHEQ